MPERRRFLLGGTMLTLKNNPILTKYQIEILKLFFSSSLGKQFFLTGGTALAAFYLAHMLSRVQDITSFPKTMKPFDQKDLVRFFLNLSEDLFEAVKPKER